MVSSRQYWIAAWGPLWRNVNGAAIHCLRASLIHSSRGGCRTSRMGGERRLCGGLLPRERSSGNPSQPETPMPAAAYPTRLVHEGVRGKNPLFFPRRLSAAFDARKRPPSRKTTPPWRNLPSTARVYSDIHKRASGTAPDARSLQFYSNGTYTRVLKDSAMMKYRGCSRQPAPVDWYSTVSTTQPGTACLKASTASGVRFLL